jgi:hypothetical protein
MHAYDGINHIHTASYVGRRFLSVFLHFFLEIPEVKCSEKRRTASVKLKFFLFSGFEVEIGCYEISE